MRIDVEMPAQKSTKTKKSTGRVAFNVQHLKANGSITSGTYTQIALDIPDRKGTLVLAVLSLEVFFTTPIPASKYQNIYLTNASLASEPTPDNENVMACYKTKTEAAYVADRIEPQQIRIAMDAPLPTRERKLYVGIMENIASEVYYVRLNWVPRSVPGIDQPGSLTSKSQY